MLLAMGLAAIMTGNAQFDCVEKGTNRNTTIELQINRYEPSLMVACTDNAVDCGIMIMRDMIAEQHDDYEIFKWYSEEVGINGDIFFNADFTHITLRGENFTQTFYCE